MAPSRSVLTDLFDACRAGTGVDLVRDAARMAMPALLAAEATEPISTILAEPNTGDGLRGPTSNPPPHGVIAGKPERY